MTWHQHDTVWVHDDVIKWKHFPRYWPFVRGIHRSPVTRSFDVFFDLRLNKRLSKQSQGWSDLRLNRAHCDVIVVCWKNLLYSYRNLDSSFNTISIYNTHILVPNHLSISENPQHIGLIDRYIFRTWVLGVDWIWTDIWIHIFVLYCHIICVIITMRYISMYLFHIARTIKMITLYISEIFLYFQEKHGKCYRCNEA